MENEFDYVVAAYIVALVPLAYMFFTNRKAYRSLKREVAKARVAKPRKAKKKK